MQIESPIGDRSKLHGETEEGHHDLGGLLEGDAVGALHRYRGELAALPVQLRDLTELEADIATLDEVEHLLHRGRRRAKLGAAVQQGERLGDGLQIQRPIERGIAAADDEHVAILEILHLAHGVEDRGALIMLDAGKRRPLRGEGPAARGDHQDLAFELGAAIGGEPEAVIEALETFDPLIEMELGAEGLDLCHEPVGQLLAADHGEPRDVVDRLLWVELGALAARAVENVDDMGLDVDEAELEHGKEAYGPCPYNDGVGLDHVL